MIQKNKRGSVSKKSSYEPPKSAQSLAAPSVWDKHAGKLYLFLAFFIPFFIMFVSFAISGVSPFGTNQIHATDLWHQYYPFMVDYQDKLQEGGSLLWT